MESEGWFQPFVGIHTRFCGEMCAWVPLQDWVDIFLWVSSSKFTYLVGFSQVEGYKLLFTQGNWAGFLSRKVTFLQFTLWAARVEGFHFMISCFILMLVLFFFYCPRFFFPLQRNCDTLLGSWVKLVLWHLWLSNCVQRRFLGFSLSLDSLWFDKFFL